MAVDLGVIQDKIEGISSIPPDENRTGVWLRHRVEGSFDLYECENCGALVASKRAVCPCCHSAMAEED